MSGHSKWSQIKHKKGAADKKRGQLFSKLARSITIAARDGADPDANFKLRLAIETARAAAVPKENIERAIEKASGKEGQLLENAVYEGFGPGGSGFIVEAATDNRNRSSSEIRHLFEKQGGNMAQPNAVAWSFESKGEILARLNNAPADELELMVIDAGAEDVKVTEDGLEVYTTPLDLEKTKQLLEKSGAEVVHAEVAMKPKNTVSLSDADRKKAQMLYEELLEHGDVINVYTSAEL